MQERAGPRCSTTVLAYAAGADHSLRDPCRDLLGAVGEGLVADIAHVVPDAAGVAALLEA